MAARDSDFYTGETLDPFAGLAPAEDPSVAEAAALMRQRLAATRTANINMQQNPDGRTPIRAGAIDPKTGKKYTGLERPKGEGFWKESWDTVKNDPWLLALPAAPLALAAAAPAAAGSGSISAANAGLAASESAAASAAPTVGYAATSAPFSMASPSVAGAAGAAPGAAGAAGAAGTTAAAASPWATAAGYGTKLAEVAAPFLIQAALGGKTKEDKALIAKGEQLAQEAKVRQGQQQDARMNKLGQQLLAFNPTNQLMAKMYGPQAAFQPEQMAAMVQGQAPAYDEKWNNYTGTDPKVQKDVEEYIRRKKEYDLAEASRREMMLNGITAPGPGPTPIQMPTPQAARRY
jgi:hypothetical protein